MSSVSSTDGGYQYYQRNLSDLENEMREETRRAQQRYEERADSLDRKYVEDTQRSNEKNEKAADTIRRQSSDEMDRVRESARADVERARAQTYDKNGKVQAEIAFQKDRADRAIAEAQKQIQHDQEQIDKQNHMALEKANMAAADRLTKNEEMSHASHERETNQLRDTMKNLINEERSYMKEKGQGTVDARRALEDEFHTQQRVLSQQYQGEIEGLKRQARETDHRNDQLAKEQKLESDRYYNNLRHHDNVEHHLDQELLKKNDATAIAQVKETARQQQLHSDRAMEHQADLMARQNSENLGKQAELSRDELARQKQMYTQEVDSLQHDIQQHLSSGDETFVSPAAEAKMKHGFVTEYEKKLNAEVARDKGKTDSIQKEYTSRLASTIQQADNRVAKTELQRRTDEHMQRQTYMNSIAELQTAQQETLREKDAQSLQSSENLHRTYGHSIERQRGEYETMIDQLKADANEKITDLRQKSEFDLKMAQRNFATQQYEMNRGYEKKLDDQRNFYEDAIANLKDQLNQQNREAERRTRQLLDDQSKGYEQKIAQNEYQTKERERNMSDAYQDQIEKLKRTNALLIQRKS